MGAIMPTYDSPQVTPSAVAMPQAQAASADTFGAGLVKGMNQLGDAVESIRRQNNLETAQKFQAFVGQLNAQTEVEIKSYQGEDVFGNKDNPQGKMRPLLTSYDEKVSDWIQKNAGGNQQFDYLLNKAQESRNAIEHVALTHELSEKKTAQVNSFNAAQSVIINQLAVTAADPNRQDEHDKAYDDGIANIEAFANAHGWTQEQLDQHVATFEQDATTTKAKQILMVNPVSAKNFIEENKDILGTNYTALKQSVELVAAEQQGINAAEEISPRLYKEDYTVLRKELFTRFGGGTANFDYKGFKIAESQLAANNQAITIAKKQNLEKLTVPIYQAILDTEKTGAKMSPKQLSLLPEYREMMTSTDPEVVRFAATLMDKVYGEHRQEVMEQRAEARFERSMNAQGRSAANQARTDAQRNAWMELYANPDVVAGMSKGDVMQVASQLGQYGDDLIKMHQRSTSPEALASIKIESSTFKSVMETLKIPKNQQGQVQESLKTYLIREQQDNQRVLTKDQIRAAIGMAVQDVQVNVRQSFLGVDMGTTTVKKKLYEVGNQDAIVIPRDTVKQIAPLLRAYGIQDTHRNRLRIYKGLLAEGRAK